LARTGGLAVALLVFLVVPARAQRGWDVQGHAVGMVRDSVLLGAGLGAGLRLARGLRVSATTSAGGGEGGARGRGEALVTYHVSPPRRGGVGIYVGGGLAGELWDGGARGLAVLLAGIEARPWNGGGWFVEVGVGGGARLAAGYRLIRLARRR